MFLDDIFCIKFLGKVDNAHFREYNIFSFSWLLKIGKCCKNSIECRLLYR